MNLFALSTVQDSAARLAVFSASLSSASSGHVFCPGQHQYGGAGRGCQDQAVTAAVRWCPVNCVLGCIVLQPLVPRLPVLRLHGGPREAGGAHLLLVRPKHPQDNLRMCGQGKEMRDDDKNLKTAIVWVVGQQEITKFILHFCPLISSKTVFASYLVSVSVPH